MNTAPILILQMQRMGDLVLSFPLLAWLKTVFPAHPVWVVGEECFFTPLMALSPEATYLSYENSQRLASTPFHLIINLSHRQEAARLAGALQSDEMLGAYTRDNARHIRGNWQLYRASITHNNQYNHYHWSDLNALDCIPLATIRRTSWPKPAQHGARNKRIGLFLGASEAIKRPDAHFWSGLARQLIDLGLHPVLLGGSAEQALGKEVAGNLQNSTLNLCGKFSVQQLYAVIQQLDLLVTPDTGPMHIATWAGTKVLNLSMGNVNPWETGPMSPGHYVVRANVPCLNCWQCTQPSVICKDLFSPRRTADIIKTLLSDSTDAPHPGHGVHILQTGRDNGLYSLRELSLLPDEKDAGEAFYTHHFAIQEALGSFWKAWFAGQFGLAQQQPHTLAWQHLNRVAPAITEKIHAAARRFIVDLLRSAKKSANPLLDDTDFWRRYCPELHPLTGFLQLYAQNQPACPQTFPRILRQCEELLALPLS